MRTAADRPRSAVSVCGGHMDQQLERNELQKLRELLAAVLRTQEAILHRLTQLEERLEKGRD